MDEFMFTGKRILSKLNKNLLLILSSIIFLSLVTGYFISHQSLDNPVKWIFIIFALLGGGYLVVVKLHWGVYLILWMSYLNIIFSDLVGETKLFSGLKLFGALVVLVWLFQMQSRGNLSIYIGKSGIFLILLILMMTLSSFYNMYGSLNIFLQVISSLVFYVLMVNILKDKNHFRGFIQQLILLALLISTVTIIQYALNIGESTYLSRGEFKNVYIGLGGGLADFNDQTILINLAIPLIPFAFKNRRYRHIFIIIIGTVLASGVLVTGSRSGIIVMALLLILSSSIYTEYRFIFGIGVGLSLVLFNYVPSWRGFIERFSLSNASGLQSIMNRFLAWETGIKMGADNMLFGVGPGGWNKAFLKYSSSLKFIRPHNTFVEAYAELGITGLILILIMFISIILRVKKNSHITCENFKHIKWSLLIMLVGYISMIMTLNHLYSRDIFIIAGLVDTYCKELK